MYDPSSSDPPDPPKIWDCVFYHTQIKKDI